MASPSSLIMRSPSLQRRTRVATTVFHVLVMIGTALVNSGPRPFTMAMRTRTNVSPEEPFAAAVGDDHLNKFDAGALSAETDLDLQERASTASGSTTPTLSGAVSPSAVELGGRIPTPDAGCSGMLGKTKRTKKTLLKKIISKNDTRTKKPEVRQAVKLKEEEEAAKVKEVEQLHSSRFDSYNEGLSGLVRQGSWPPGSGEKGDEVEDDPSASFGGSRLFARQSSAGLSRPEPNLARPQSVAEERVDTDLLLATSDAGVAVANAGTASTSTTCEQERGAQAQEQIPMHAATAGSKLRRISAGKRLGALGATRSPGRPGVSGAGTVNYVMPADADFPGSPPLDRVRRLLTGFVLSSSAPEVETEKRRNPDPNPKHVEGRERGVQLQGDGDREVEEMQDEVVIGNEVASDAQRSKGGSPDEAPGDAVDVDVPEASPSASGAAVVGHGLGPSSPSASPAMSPVLRLSKPASRSPNRFGHHQQSTAVRPGRAPSSAARIQPERLAYSAEWSATSSSSSAESGAGSGEALERGTVGTKRKRIPLLLPYFSQTVSRARANPCDEHDAPCHWTIIDSYDPAVLTVVDSFLQKHETEAYCVLSADKSQTILGVTGKWLQRTGLVWSDVLKANRGSGIRSAVRGPHWNRLRGNQPLAFGRRLWYGDQVPYELRELVNHRKWGHPRDAWTPQPTAPLDIGVHEPGTGTGTRGRELFLNGTPNGREYVISFPNQWHRAGSYHYAATVKVSRLLSEDVEGLRPVAYLLHLKETKEEFDQ